MRKIIRTSTIPESLFSLLNGQLKYLSQYFEILGVSSNGFFLDETSNKEGVKTIGVDMERGISPFKDLISLFKLYKVFLKQKPMVVHSITPKAGLLSMLAAKMAGVPIRMHTFTGLIFPTRTGFIQKVLINMDRLLCWSATNIYPEGNGVKNDLISYKITSKPLKVIANGNVNGIDLDYFDPAICSDFSITELKKSLNINPKDFVFIFVGRLVGDKGINELVKAFSTLSISNVKLLLVGPLESELDPLKKETLDEIDHNDNIISVGFQNDVRPYFAISDALAFPSYREGFPNVVIQAGAMELPSIVTDISGCNEIIQEGKNGRIIPVKNVEVLQKTMEEYIANKILYMKLKSNARDMIVSRYEQSVVWNALLDEYMFLIEELKMNKKKN